MTGQLSYAIWLSLPNDVRHKLVTLFNIPRSGMTIVDYRATGAVVTSDGYTAIDLQAITLDRMKGLLGSEDDNFYKLFEEIVSNIDTVITGNYQSVVPDSADSEHNFFRENPEYVVKVFCKFCTSKGVRHKKDCTRII